MRFSTLVLRYSAFAAIATLVNLAAQRLVFLSGSGNIQFAFAILTGTIAGLLVKYVLDKRWIFEDTAQGLGQHGRKFSLYTAMGLITTAIFWGMEMSFWALWGTDLMREVGAIIGLAIGYVVKYNLDRRFVFNIPASGATR